MPVILEGIALPSDIQWIDEFSGFGVGQEVTPTLTGALVIEESAQVDGRPITLDSGVGSWVDRVVVEQLAALIETPLEDDQTLSFEWADGRTFDVVIDRDKLPTQWATEVIRVSAEFHSDGHPYSIKLPLLAKA